MSEAQTVTRWHRLPWQGKPKTINHPLAGADQPGELLRFRYETLPQTPMMRRIKRGFNELFPEPVASDSFIDISRTTQVLEKLEQEAEAARMAGYQGLATGSDYSLFDPDSRPPAEVASTGFEIINIDRVPTASVSLTITGN